jgi:hypothetical protein
LDSNAPWWYYRWFEKWKIGVYNPDNAYTTFNIARPPRISMPMIESYYETEGLLGEGMSELRSPETAFPDFARLPLENERL